MDIGENLSMLSQLIPSMLFPLYCAQPFEHFSF
jgi:hypothetical protein